MIKGKIYKGFRIENIPAYIWRTYCWGSHSGHAYVACWYVFDDKDRKVSGGYDSGNNTRSGHANLARLKDAKAWVDGWHAFHDQPENRMRLDNGFIVHAPTYAQHRSDLAEQQAWFEHGYQYAQR